MSLPEESKLFSALLKYWRQKRGLSQLDLALAAEVSARHLSFLETGRARPSREMILGLASTLDLPLREQNALLVAAGFSEAFTESNPSGALPPVIERVLDRMFAQQEPYPMVALDRCYDVLRANQGAAALLSCFSKEPIKGRLNVLKLLFDPQQARGFVVEWERVARLLLSRLQRETLIRPSSALSTLLTTLLAYPEVPTSFRRLDATLPNEPVLVFRMKRDDTEVAFLTTVTVFDAPNHLTLSELRVESYFPLDDQTAAFCEKLAQ
jgi:transcriptional regulator with XRE-family HTH domain